MKNSMETQLGLFVLLAMVAGFVILELTGNVNFFKRSYHLRAEFSNIQDLKTGDPVKIAGVPIGQVEKIGLDGTNSKVALTLRLVRGTAVHTDSKATIKFAGLLGQNYVAISFGSPTAPLFDEGAQIQTVEQPDFSVLMAKLDEAASGVQNLTKSFSGDKIDNILGPFTDFMKQNNPRLTAMIANFEGVSKEIAEGKGTVGKLIYDETLYNSVYSSVTNLQEVAAEIKGTVAQARAVVDEVNAGHGTVGRLLKDDSMFVETTNALTNMREILQKVNQGQGTVGKLVNDQEFYKNAKLSLQKLDKATESLEDTGPLSIIGTMVNSLF